MRKTFKNLFLITLLLCVFAAAQAQKVSRQTYVYAIKGADTLRLDKYATVASKTDTVSRPVVLFAFGGGFTGGNRNDRRYVPFFMHLVRSGFTVVTVDYRTGLKGIEPSKLSTLEGFATSLASAVKMAVEDYATATAFVVKHSKTWKLNPKKIVACGSSAGAITVLQTEYMLRNGSELTSMMPQNFNYAGVVSFAGAVFTQGGLQWKEQPCPIMLFHGDADRRVPFDKIEAGGFGMYGSAAIAAQLKASQQPYWFVKVEGAGHEIAINPMKENRDDINKFLKDFVIDGKKDNVESVIEAHGHHGQKPNLTIEDYIKENMKQ